MHINDIILGCLTAGNVLNPKNRVWRSMQVLEAFTKLEQGDILGILAGDLEGKVVVRVGKKGVMVALFENVPDAEALGDAPQKVVAGNAHVPPAPEGLAIKAEAGVDAKQFAEAYYPEEPAVFEDFDEDQED